MFSWYFAEQSGGRQQHVHRVGQALPVVADDFVAEVGQTGRADQQGVEVLLLVDDGPADAGGVVDGADQIGEASA